jgi:hypothetical protein
VSYIVSQRKREHTWREYDEHHRACDVCGLRLFWTRGTAYGQRGWVLMTHTGIVSPHLLGDGGGDFGWCEPPEDPPIAETVLIEYTGDPDVHPGCERFMHRVRGMPRDGAAALLDLRTIRPACGWRCEWWELGPARDHVGWTWCFECWSRGSTRHVRISQVRPELPPPRPRELEPAPRNRLKGKP